MIKLKRQSSHSHKNNVDNIQTTNSNGIFCNYYKHNIKPTTTRNRKELVTYTSCPNISKEPRNSGHNTNTNTNTKQLNQNNELNKCILMDIPSKIKFKKSRQVNSLRLINQMSIPKSLSTLPLLIQHNHFNTSTKHPHNEDIKQVTKQKILSTMINSNRSNNTHKQQKSQTIQNRCEQKEISNEQKNQIALIGLDSDEDSFYQELHDLVKNIDKHLSREESCKSNKMMLKRKQIMQKDMFVHHINNIVPSNIKNRHGEHGKMKSVWKLQINKGNNNNHYQQHKQIIKMNVPQLQLDSVNEHNNHSDKNIRIMKSLSERPGTSYGHVRFKSQSKLNKLTSNNINNAKE